MTDRRYVEELIEQGLMTETGLSKIEIAKQNGSWQSLDAIEALIIPPDLQDAIAANEAAHKNFEAFSNTTKKLVLTWIGSAKRAEIWQKKIKKTVIAAAQNQNPLR